MSTNNTQAIKPYTLYLTQPPSTETRIAFHKHHSKDIQLEDDSAAVRIQYSANWSSGLLFSSEPIQINQKIYLKLLVVSLTHDIIDIGFTSANPEDVNYMKTESDDSWTCSLSKYFCTEGTVLCFYVNEAGVINYGKLNGRTFQVRRKRVDVSRPVWAVCRICSEPTKVKLIPEEVVLGLESWC